MIERYENIKSHYFAPAMNQNNIVIGDSIAEGAGFAQGWLRSGGEKYRNVAGVPSYYMEQYTGKFWINMGYDGNLIADVIARINTHVTPYNPPMILLHVGINTVNNTILTEQQIKDSFDTIFTAFAGYKVAVMSLPYQTKNGKLATIQALNTWLEGRCTALGMAWVNYYPYVEANGGNAAVYVDDIHPKAAGYAAIIPNYVIPPMQAKGWI